MEKEEEHYLKNELYELIQTTPEIFEFLQTGSLDGIWYWDLINPEHEWLSPRFKEVFGYEEHEIPHTSAWWQNNIFPEDRELALDNFDKHCADSNHPYDQIVRYRHKNGSVVWVRCRGVVIRDEEGTPMRMLGAHTDVTELKQAEEELARANADLKREVAEREQAQQALEASNEELKQFAYVASHNLQEPLRSITSFIELLRDDYHGRLDDEADEYIGFIVDTAERMQALINDVLDYSRMGRGQLSLESIDSNAVVKQVLRSLHTAIAEANVDVVLAPLPVIEADPRQIGMVFQNLISNAVKFRNTQQPTVHVSARQQDGMWQFSIKDNGVGIKREHQDRIFELFKRLHSRKKYKGTGIGLALCKKVVERHGGRIWVDTEVGTGSTFHFTIPQSKT